MVVQLKDVLKSLIEESLGIPRILEEHKLSSAWGRINTPDILKNTSFEKISSGVLYVNTKNSAWAQQINLLKPEIISKLNEAIGKAIVCDIRPKCGVMDKAVEEKKAQTFRTCASCNAQHYGKNELCEICLRKETQERQGKLFRLVKREPKIAYDAAKAAIPGISEVDFRRVKRDLRAIKLDNEQNKRRFHGR